MNYIMNIKLSGLTWYDLKLVKPKPNQLCVFVGEHGDVMKGYLNKFRLFKTYAYYENAVLENPIYYLPAFCNQLNNINYDYLIHNINTKDINKDFIL